MREAKRLRKLSDELDAFLALKKDQKSYAVLGSRNNTVCRKIALDLPELVYVRVPTFDLIGKTRLSSSTRKLRTT